jgi:hypothetical protein
MSEKSPPDEFTKDEIVSRRDAAIRRALNAPHRPAKDLIGKTERAKAQRETRALRYKPKGGEAS